MKHPYTLEAMKEADVMQYDGIGWLASGVWHDSNSATLQIDGKYYEITQTDLDKTFSQIVEDRISGDLHDQHFQEVLEDTIVGWDWVLRYALTAQGMTIIGA